MSAGAPWSVKGIDPKAREVAKDLARRSGMTLGEWLNRVILEDDIPEEVATEADFGRRTFHDAARQGVTPELTRISQALDRVTGRIEASETRTGLAISGVEHAIRQAVARIETAEREQLAVSARLDRALDESMAQHERHAERLARLEEAGPRSPEALRMLEARVARLEPEALADDVLARLGERLALAEARTEAALDALRGSLGRLDERFAHSQAGRFEALAEDLSRRVEALRAEVAEKLSGAVGEDRLAEMAEHVRTAERRSTRAVEDLGRQVLTMAEAVSRKLTDVDQRSADAIDQVGSEVARIAGAVEQRLARQEHAQAEGFERLRAEFSISYPRPAPAPDPAEPEAPAAAAPAPAGPFEAEPAEQPEWLAAAALLGDPPEPEPEAETIAAFGPELFSRAEPEPGPDSEATETVDAPWRRLDMEAPEPVDLPDAFAPLS